jgi:hypothetical protein
MPALLVRRDDPARGELRPDAAPSPADGEALLRVERFALTSNNITYARLGDELGYWRLFPADGGWGRVPAWAYVRVAQSHVPDRATGERFFGLAPMGSWLTVQPVARGRGFADAAPHRAGLSPVYNSYLPVDEDADDAALVMRPLFGTSVVLDLLLTESGFAGAGTVVVTSASSKAGYGLAFLLRSRPVRVVGLTSAHRRAWVDGLGCYDEVLDYGQLDRLAAPDGAVLVDFAGNQELLREAHERLGGALRRSILVGYTHRPAGEEGGRDGAPLPGPAPEFFFSPDEMVRRRGELGPRYAEAWRAFAPFAATTMRIVRIDDGESLLRAYRDLSAGRVDPEVGYVVTLT